MQSDPERLREQAGSWTLSSDHHLLALLKQMHQNVMGKAQDINTKLEEMMTSVNEASVSFQNVNNSLQALSSSQFVENRVYEDDADVTPLRDDIKDSVKTTHSGNSDLIQLKDSLKTLQEFYEEVTIMADTDSDTDSEGDNMQSVVLKAKDLYTDRPLPHIIGTASWKNKWHAGLLEEQDSDSASSVCDRDSKQDMYSSEGEDTPTQQELSEEIAASDEDYTENNEPIAEDIPPYVPMQSQPNFAAQLSQRLYAGRVAETQQTVTANLMPDEPPPLPAASCASSEEELDDDIFAEMHRPRARSLQRNKEKDIFRDFKETSYDYPNENIQSFDNNLNIKAKENEKEKKENVIIENEKIVKKPAGAKSLFGSTIGSESIGAAILKRNRKASTSSDEDIPKAIQKSTAKPKVKLTQEPVPQKQIDTSNDFHRNSEQNTKKIEFDDDIFDDIDDIFAADIVSSVTVTEASAKKNIFDDEDDLFADLDIQFDKDTKKKDTVIKSAGNKNMTMNTVKANDFDKIFDDDEDDDLFDNIETSKVSSMVKSEPPFGEADDNLFEADDDFSNNNNRYTEETKSMDPVKNDSEIININNNLIDAQMSNKNVPLLEQDEDSLFNTNLNQQTQNVNASENQSQFETPITSNKFKGSEFKDSSETIVTYEQNDNKDIEHVDDHIQPPPLTVSDSTEKENIMKSDINNELVKDNEKVENYSNLTAKDVFIESEVIRKNKAGTDDLMKNEKINSSDKYNELFKDNEKVESNSNVTSKDFFVEPKDLSKNKDTPGNEIKADIDVKVENIEKLADFKSISANVNVFSEDIDSFDNIFNDQPPAFEKSTETKRSKNINALFDDDSDDEALFFKKNDAIEETPDDFMTSNVSAPTFGIFNDEPPAIDDFDDYYLFKKTDTEKNVHDNENILIDSPDHNIIPSSKVLDAPVPEGVREPSTDTVSKQLEENIDSIEEHKVKETNKRPIGKIKTNINININTLLPGASPKKYRNDAQIDTVDAKLDESYDILDNFTNEIQSKLVKSASFKENPESPILCNKISKDRAKIQVKRRPSSRKARKDAIRKSNTDSDIDKNLDLCDSPELTKDLPGISALGKVYSHVLNEPNVKIDKVEDLDKSFESLSQEKEADNSVLHIIDNGDDIFKDPNEILKEIKSDSKESLINNAKDKQCKNDTKSEIEVIFDKDDLLFQGKTSKSDPIVGGKHNIVDKKQLLIEDSDEEDIFKTFSQNTKQKTETLNKAKEKPKEIKRETTKKSFLFDDSSDEELFGSGNSEGRIVKNTSKAPKDTSQLFQTQKIMKTSDSMRKTSLFGDESDDDGDLFGKKSVNKGEQRTLPVANKEKPMPPQSSLDTPFEDPLSVLGDKEEFV